MASHLQIIHLSHLLLFLLLTAYKQIPLPSLQTFKPRVQTVINGKVYAVSPGLSLYLTYTQSKPPIHSFLQIHLIMNSYSYHHHTQLLFCRLDKVLEEKLLYDVFCYIVALVYGLILLGGRVYRCAFISVHNTIPEIIWDDITGIYPGRNQM